MVQLCLFEVISFLPPSEYSFLWSLLHGFKIVCFELNFHETEKKIKVSSSCTLHSMSFASLFSHTGLHIQNIFVISRDDGNERDKQRDGERCTEREEGGSGQFSLRRTVKPSCCSHKLTLPSNYFSLFINSFSLSWFSVVAFSVVKS